MCVGDPAHGARAVPVLEEWHTSEITDPCLKRVQLRHEGKQIKSYTSALFKGQVAHRALQLVHERAEWWEPIEPIIEEAVRDVQAEAVRESRPLSPAVMRTLDQLTKQATAPVEHYRDRLRSRFMEVETLGCEVPARCTLEVAGESVQLATHIDLLWRDAVGLHAWDWKLREQQPDWDYLQRNLQFGLMFLCLAWGHVLVRGEWLHPAAEAVDMGWVDLTRFKPYVKQGTPRPLHRIIREWRISLDDTQEIVSAIWERIQVARIGWPANPEPVRCLTCESKQFCTSFGRTFGDESP